MPPTNTTPAGRLELRGISYDTGTDYAGTPTRVRWRPREVHHDIQAIRHELHCTAVNVYGSHPARLVEAAEMALDMGLDVWVQPRLIDHPHEAVLAHLSRTAAETERLRSGLTTSEVQRRVVLNLGCEWSVFTPGIIPGDDYQARAHALSRPRWWPFVPWFNRKLARLVRHAAAEAREQFTGPITYSAGLWEHLDWSQLDYVGLNYYRMRHNRIGYEHRLRRQRRHGRPVVITEFGCGCFTGADNLGPESHTIVDYASGQPRLLPGHTRDEHVQAQYLAHLLAIYQRSGVHGAFAFEFIEPYKPHRADPTQDLDMSGYALVKTMTEPSSNGLRWEPKAAFHTLARIYSAAD